MTDHSPDLDWPRLAARYRMNLLDAGEMKTIARRLIQMGHWSEAIDEVYLSLYPSRSELDPYWERIMVELAVGLPSEEEAPWILLRAYVTDIAQGSVPPREGLQLVCDDVYYGTSLWQQTETYAGDSHGIEHLLGLYWTYDEIDEEGLYGRGSPREIKKVDRLVVQAAQEWLSSYGENEPVQEQGSQ